MLNKTFNPNELLRNTSLKDVIKYKLGRDRESIKNALTKISYKITDENFKLKSIKKEYKSGSFVYLTRSASEYYALKQTDYILRKIYKIGFSNKSKITNQICSVLTDGYDYQILRIDIRKFFEETNRSKVIEKIKNDSLLSSQMISKVIDYDNYFIKEGVTGLPRGLALSSTLSELYLRKLDRKINEDTRVYFYARYVDDIIVICTDGYKEISSAIDGELSKVGLYKNNKKTKNVLMGSKEERHFDYLGYKYTFKPCGKRVEIGVSEKKIKKIKSRVISCLLSYCNDRDFMLLDLRLKFLTGNHFLYKDGLLSKLKSGLYYSNQNINDFTCLNELDEFLRKSITSKKGSFGGKMKSIPVEVVTEILKSSFFQGFISKKTYSFTNEEFSRIKACWKNE